MKTIPQLVDQLKNLTASWNEFDLVPKEQQDECRKIGEQIFAMGNEDLMQKAYYMAKEQNRCASVISAYWDGIGSWRW